MEMLNESQKCIAHAIYIKIKFYFSLSIQIFIEIEKQIVENIINIHIT